MCVCKHLHTQTPVLLNGMAACKMHMGIFDEAEKYLLKALASSSSDIQTVQYHYHLD